MAGETRVKTVPQADYGNAVEHVRRIVQAVDGLQNGQGNNHFLVTLSPGETETSINAPSARTGGVATLQAMSESAAASLASGKLIWSTVERAWIVIHHDAATAADRDFGVVLNG